MKRRRRGGTAKEEHGEGQDETEATSELHTRRNVRICLHPWIIYSMRCLRDYNSNSSISPPALRTLRGSTFTDKQEVLTLRDKQCETLSAEWRVRSRYAARLLTRRPSLFHLATTFLPLRFRLRSEAPVVLPLLGKGSAY